MSKQIDVVVLGLSPTGLYAVREAARAGHHVMGVGEPTACGLWSRHLTERISADEATDRVDAIIGHFAQNALKKPVLIVTSDQDLEAVMARANELSNLVHMPNAYRNGLAARIMEKDRFYELCQANEVSYPRFRSVSLDQAASYRDQIAYPCIIKPARIQDVKHLMDGQKGWIIKNPREFDLTLSKIPAEAGNLLMQEIVPGAESSITLWCGYIDSAGSIRQSFTARKLRQYPPGFGSASLVQSEDNAETAEIAERLLKTLNYDGIAAAEFKRHPETGKLNIIEINPRPSLWFSISTAAGVRLIETAIADLTDTRLPARARQINGIRWRYEIKDQASQLFYSRTRNFVLPSPDVECAGHAQGQAYALSSWDDPAPILRELWNFARKMARRIGGKVSQKK